MDARTTTTTGEHRPATGRQTTATVGSRTRRAGRRLRGALAVGAAIGLYATVVRPRLNRLGATADETAAALPGDALRPDARFESTNAVTVDAPASDVWPWLAQLGQGRGGFYSYTSLENLAGLDIHNADEIVPEWQDVAVGDVVRLAREDYPSDGHLVVALADPDRALVLRTPDDPPTWVWSFHLLPVDETSCRLVVRSRVGLDALPGRLGMALLEPVATLMTVGMLRGLKRRAEGRLDG
jgi:hypothetical protein